MTDDLAYFTRGSQLDEDTRARFTARSIRIFETPVDQLVAAEGGGIAGVRLAGGQLVPRRGLAVAASIQVRKHYDDDQIAAYGQGSLQAPVRDMLG